MHQRDFILQKNQFGVAPNEAGPIWMGLRLNTHKNPGAYRLMIYPKGGYILHMLRAIMSDNKTGDAQFIAMMQDFVKSHYNQNASTESFKKVVERHMTPAMDLDQNGRMDWFFNQWVYGSEIPHYKFIYKLSPSDDGKFIVEGTLTQSGVSDGFKMLVPVYGEFDGKFYNMKSIAVTGNNATTFKLKVPQQPKSVTINHYHDILSYDK
jgi:aminopeptidase N